MAETGENFEAMYAARIAPELANREAARKEAVRRHNLALGVGLAVSVVALIIGNMRQAESGALVLFGGAPIAAAWFYGRWELRKVAKDVKTVLMNAIAAHAGLRFSEAVPTPPAFDTFMQRRLLPRYTRKTFEDLIEGERAGCAFQLYEAHLQERRQSGRSSTMVTVFRGQLVRIAFPTAFHGTTVVLRDAGMFNFAKGAGSDLKRVGLVDPVFEKAFEVFGSDQVEARYLLTPTFMERLLELERELEGSKLRAAFTGGDLLIAVEGGDMFEAGSMFETLHDPERARRIMGEIETIHGMIDALLAPRPAPGGAA